MSSRGSITKRKRKKGYVYESRWYEEGTQRSRNFNTAADAKAFLNAVMTKLARGEPTTYSGNSTTLDEWFQAWMQRPLRPSTASRDRSVMERWWLPALGDTPLSEIKRLHIQGVVDSMDALSPVTVRTHYGVMRACMAAAVDEDMIGRTPCRAISLPQQDNDKAEIRFLEPDELDRLADAIGEHRALIYVAGVCGLRWSECVGLQVKHVNLLTKKLSVERTLTEVAGVFSVGPPKTKAGRRTLTLPTFVVDALAQHLQAKHLTGVNSEELIFSSPSDEPLRRSNFRRRVFDPAVHLAQLDGLTFHGLRHTAAGLMIAGGYTPAIIQKRLGHASIRTTYDVYGHLLPSADATVAAGLEAMWSAQHDERAEEGSI